MDSGMFRGLDKLFYALAVMATIGIVLGIVNGLQFAWWLFHHVSVAVR